MIFSCFKNHTMEAIPSIPSLLFLLYVSIITAICLSDWCIHEVNMHFIKSNLDSKRMFLGRLNLGEVCWPMLYPYYHLTNNNYNIVTQAKWIKIPLWKFNENYSTSSNWWYTPFKGEVWKIEGKILNYYSREFLINNYWLSQYKGSVVIYWEGRLVQTEGAAYLILLASP